MPWLGGAIVAGGIVGPLLLMAGLSHTDAAAASLLLTLEGVATAVLAWFVFHENFDRRVRSWHGMPRGWRDRALLDRPAHLVRHYRAARHCRSLRRLGARQQSDTQGVACRSAPDRRAERPHRWAFQLALGVVAGGSLPGLAESVVEVRRFLSVTVSASPYLFSRCGIWEPPAPVPISRPLRSWGWLPRWHFCVNPSLLSCSRLDY